MRRSARPIVRFLAVLSVVGLTSLGLSASVASAAPGDPIDPCDLDPDLCPPDPPYEPPPNGFTWEMKPRFGPLFNGIVDYHWNEASGRSHRWGNQNDATIREKYDPAHVNPAAFDTDFFACPTADELDRSLTGQQTANTYTLVVNGAADLAQRTCRLSHSFPRQGPFSVDLLINGPNASSFTQSLTIKDHLIASIGDSYGSGEGSPDINGNWLPGPLGGQPPARWQDTRCHRSARAGAAQAALRLEAADPHSTVTFLSFACSGATINRNYNGGQPPWDPYDPGDPNKVLGTGVLGPYRGVEPVNPDNYGDKVPDQISELAKTVGNRRIDALVVSGGGNDMGFGPVAAACVWASNCITDDYFVTSANGSGPVRLQTRFDQDMALIAGRYAALDAAIDNPNPTGRPALRVARTFITQYPDPASQVVNGQVVVCDEILEDIAYALGSKMSGSEVVWARDQVMPRMNGAVATAATAHGWEVVGGHVGAFGGHGYCVGNSDQPNADRWIRTAAEAEVLQGPHKRSDTTGTLHPTSRGYQAYADALVPRLQPFLAGLPVDNRAPTANAGPDQNDVPKARDFVLQATGSDPENRPLTFRWVQLSGPPATLRSPNSPRTEVVAVNQKTTLTFQVTVTDEGGLVATDTVVVKTK